MPNLNFWVPGSTWIRAKYAQFWAGWKTVRVLGELQILTRASYFTLLFVPILAGVWPAVRAGINRYNEAVVDATHALDLASEKLAGQLRDSQIASDASEQNSLTNTRSRSHLRQASDELMLDLQHHVDMLRSSLVHQTINRKSLPLTWALAFFAALFAVIGHLLYQVFCPEEIRQASFEAFALQRKRDYASHPTELALKQAESYISGLNLKNEPWLKLSGEKEQIVEEKRDQWRDLGVIERAAHVEYHLRSKQQPRAAIASAACYLVSMLLIFVIVVSQSNAVVRATIE